MNLISFGWSEWWAQENMISSSEVARICSVQKGVYRAWCEQEGEAQEINCYLSGKFTYGVLDASEFPVVGDWVRISPPFVDETGKLGAVVAAVLPRRSHLSRVIAGKTSEEQVLVSNIDFMFLVTSLNQDFNLKRLRRYLLLAKNGGVEPVIVLSKSDLVPNYLEYVEQVQSLSENLRCVVTSAVEGLGLVQLKEMMLPGTTSVFVGSSGVGKSTLVNKVLEKEIQKTREIRGR